MEKALKEKGAKRLVRLNVSGPFHTKYMKPAAEELRKYFEKMEFMTPSIPVALNVTGDIYKYGEDLKELLVKQVQSGVRLEDELSLFINKGYDRFIEIGPGNTIAGFLKKTARKLGKEISVMSIDKVEDFEKLI